MKHSAEMRRCLEQVDVAGARKLWRHVRPNMPQPKNDDEALIIIHHARTQSVWLNFRLRAYSHAWLTERGIPSGLPDSMRKKAERLYPRIVEGVGISVNSKYPELKKAVQGAMEDRVNELYSAGITEPLVVKAHMRDARNTALRRLVR